MDKVEALTESKLHIGDEGITLVLYKTPVNGNMAQISNYHTC